MVKFWRTTLVILVNFLQVWTIDCAVFNCGAFVSDLMYDGKVLNVSGQHVEGGNVVQCSMQCFRVAGCMSFAAGSLPETASDCILYTTNMCTGNGSINLVTKLGYRMYDRVAPTSGPPQPPSSCYSIRRSLIKDCLDTSRYFNYQPTVDGCPSSFIFDESVCIKLVYTGQPTLQAALNASDPFGSYLMKIRTKGALQLLLSLMGAAREGIVYLGLTGYGNGTHHNWHWSDGTPMAVPTDKSYFLQWAEGDPNYSRENYAVLAPPKYCWNDVISADSTMHACQASTNAQGKCDSGFSLNPKSNGTTCYGLSSDQAFAFTGNDQCMEMKGKVVALRTFDQWQFVVSLIQKSQYVGNLFSIGVAFENNIWIYKNGGQPANNYSQWCPDEPDYAKEACGVLIVNEGLRDLHCTRVKPYAKEWIASSCTEWYQLGHNTSNGIYRIRPRGTDQDFQVYCDMLMNGGGWTVIQSRQGSSISFQRNSSDYNIGFGNISTSDFWLGLDKMFLLTSQERVSLMLSLKSAAGKQINIFYSRFQLFQVKNASYVFRVENFKTTSGMSDEFGKQQFSPFIVDPIKGGWWYGGGSAVNLNGHPDTTNSDSANAMQWSPGEYLAGAIMKVKTTYFSECSQI